MNPIVPPTAEMSWQQVAVWIGFYVTQALIAWMMYNNHKLMNSRLSELQEETKKASHAEGMAQGTEIERLRSGDMLAAKVVPVPEVTQIIERHGNGPNERHEEIKGEA